MVLPLVGMSLGGLACADLSHLASGGDDASTDDASSSPLVDAAAPPSCPANTKSCNGVCVSKDEPSAGCATAACAPCSIPYANELACRAGECGPATCQAGRADCNNRGSDGCEADLGTPATCGSCTTACPANLVCVPGTGCQSGCPAGLVNCRGACVDLATSPTNCGSCGNVCAGGANAVPSCAASACTVTCNAGYGDCDGNPSNGCEPKLPFYADVDGDGYGATLAGIACSPPAGNVSRGGDCLDTNATVHPGSTAFFVTGYSTGGTSTSYDYDCNGVEEEQTSSHGTCAAPCSYGYVPGTRLGAGVSSYCGSTTVVAFCGSGSASGSSACSTQVGAPLGCR